MGFGHRVYKNYDPRAKVIKKLAAELFTLIKKEPLIEVAKKLEEISLKDIVDVKGWKAQGNRLTSHKFVKMKEIEVEVEAKEEVEAKAKEEVKAEAKAKEEVKVEAEAKAKAKEEVKSEAKPTPEAKKLEKKKAPPKKGDNKGLGTGRRKSDETRKDNEVCVIK